MQEEERFWETLKGIFIGAEIEGESGFVNLMKIKSTYFDVVFEELELEIKERTSDSLEFRKELYDKLYSFFKRYFSESGSIYYTYTPLKEQVYEKVYTNTEDVTLFWKTHMLYYVKTDQLWKHLTVKIDDEDDNEWAISFDVSEMEHKQANEKHNPIFKLKEIDSSNKRVILQVLIATSGRKTKVDQILKELSKGDIIFTEETVERAINMFLRQNEVDYFINKDAEGFLKAQFDFWLLKDYLMDMTTVFDEGRLGQIKFMRSMAYKLIEFIAKFEEELKKIWNKPKAVLSSNYVITLDRLLSFAGGMELLEKILEIEAFKDQVKEWKELALVNDKFTIESLFMVNVYDERDVSKEWKFLSIDTKHFDKNVKEELLKLVDNHDEELDGWVIHSENYQALKTLNSRFMNNVAIIYIDPPYNIGQDDFLYKDRFMHASWLSMMKDRLSLGRNLLSSDGAIFVQIDENEQFRLEALMSEVFGRQNYIASFIWVGRGGKGGTRTSIHIAHENIESFSKDKSELNIRMIESETEGNYSDEKGDYLRELLRQWGGQGDRREDRQSMYYAITTPSGEEVYPIRPDGSEGRWRYSKDTVEGWIQTGELDFVQDEDKGRIEIYRKIRAGTIRYSAPDNLLVDFGTSAQGTKEIKALFGEKSFDTCKPLALIKHLLGGLIAVKDRNPLILDFFAGSGTTAHAIMEMNREQTENKAQFILVELADYVHDIIIPRIKKSAFSQNWKDGSPTNHDGQSLFFKYYALEQYESVLRRTIYKESHPLQYEGVDKIDMIHSYLFLDDKKLLDSVNSEGDAIEIDLRKVYPEIDLAETLANLRGKMIKRITNEGVEFVDDEFISFEKLKFSEVRELIWW